MQFFRLWSKEEPSEDEAKRHAQHFECSVIYLYRIDESWFCLTNWQIGDPNFVLMREIHG